MARIGVTRFTRLWGVCFDTRRMFRGFSSRRRVRFSFCRALCLAGVACVSGASQGHAEPSLAEVLRQAPSARDPSAELWDQLSQLERRQFAAEPAVQRALERVRSELRALATMRTQAADPARVRRRVAIAWAALSLADRLEARARTAAALAGLEARALEAEAAAQRAREAYERAQSSSVALPDTAPTHSVPAGGDAR